MAKTPRTIPQPYPRVQDADSPYYGCLDDSLLVTHAEKIPSEQLKALIRAAINAANRKSSREILSIPPDATPEAIEKIYEREGRELFRYFKKYVGDPAATAHQIYGKHYRVVGTEQVRNRTLQKERMNSGWRYQFLAVDCARSSRRFKSVSDIGAAEGDFNAILGYEDIMTLVLDVLMSSYEAENLFTEIEIPDKLLDTFGLACAKAGLINDDGIFDDPYHHSAFLHQLAPLESQMACLPVHRRTLEAVRLTEKSHLKVAEIPSLRF